MTNDVPGLAGHVDLKDVPREEVRFGVVLNGGVSLAVWMGGTVTELDRLAKADPDRPDSPYALMLRLAGCVARVDVIAGTSAGGINGAALALAQVNQAARIATLRDLWIEQGQLETLLRTPFVGSPSSLMRGDEYFLPELSKALGALAWPLKTTTAAQAPIDLTMATTVLQGNQLVTTDALGQPLPQALHAGRLRWSRWPTPERDPGTDKPLPDPFSPDRIRATASELALAARASASFPVAFEPTFVPVGEGRRPAQPGQPASQVSARSADDRRVRPDLESVVASWGEVRRSRDRSRFTVDGGLLANTPTHYALRAIQAMPADRPVRRVMLLVYPHAPMPGEDPADALDAPPTLRETLTGVLSSLSAQGGRTFVEEIEQHNRAAAGRRGTRTDILLTIAEAQTGTGRGEEEAYHGAHAAYQGTKAATKDPAAQTSSADAVPRREDRQTVESLARSLFPHYRRLRKWRAARDLARRLLDARAANIDLASAEVSAWSYERVRQAAQNAQRALDDPGNIGMPYVPERIPDAAHPDRGPGWAWGNSGAERIAEAAIDLIRRLIWVLEPGPAYEKVANAFRVISEESVRLTDCRALIDDDWETDEVLVTLEPNQSYWEFRLGCYAVLMLGVEPAGLDQQAKDLAAREGALVRTQTGAQAPADARAAEVLRAVEKRLASVREDPGHVGRTVRSHVQTVVDCLVGIVPYLPASQDADGCMTPDDGLLAWHDFLVPEAERGGQALDAEQLLTRLLQLEVASTALGDETTDGSTVAVDLVQLSAQTANAFARHSITADDKLGGMSVLRFGGFLKRSWRLNDWIWGRLDAASVLSLTVLDPSRVRRAAELSGYLVTGPPATLAEQTVDGLVASLFGAGSALVADDPRLSKLREEAVAELTVTFNPDTPPGDLPPSMPALAALFAWAIHLDVVPEDLPALLGAIRGDEVDGASTRSRGQLLVKADAAFLDGVSTKVRDGSPLTQAEKVETLAAFDRAGVGRETLASEVSSDLLIRSVTTAAAVAATTLDSPRSGLGALRLITRTLRGLMLVIYWGVVGLTSRGVARALATLALALGGVLVVLSLFGALPAAVSGPATAIGFGVLILGFSYGAMRSGTVLHGLVLLTPLVPLVAEAVTQAREDATAAGGAIQGATVVIATVVLSLGLMLLGSIPAVMGSPYAALGGLAIRAGVLPPEQPSSNTWGHLGEGIWWRLRGVSRYLDLALIRLALAVAPFGLAVWVTSSGWDRVFRTLHAHWTLCLVVGIVLSVSGIVIAGVTAFALQQLAEDRSSDRVSWAFGRVAHPVGVQVGWSALYGIGYTALALALIRDSWGWQSRTWAQALCAFAIVAGILLTVVVPIVLPLWAIRAAARLEYERARTTAAFVAVAADFGVEGSSEATISGARSYAVDLLRRDRSYRWWVRYPPPKHITDPGPSLKRRGTKLLERVEQERAAVASRTKGSSGE
ncbi:patatin-like protein [Pedococcus sp. P5_B7]